MEDRIGQAVVEAIRTKNVSPLVAIKPAGMSAELSTELDRTREVALIGTFGTLLETLKEDGHDVEAAQFDRLEQDPGSGTSIIGGGDVHFKCGDKRLYVSVSWTDSGQGPAVVGLSQWYKEAS